MKKKNKVLISIIAVVVILLVLGVSYALWVITSEQNRENIVNTACLEISIDDEADDISLQKTFPIEDSEGEKLKPYTFTVTNKCNDLATYQINLESLNKVAVENRLNPTYLKVKFNETGKPGMKIILGNLSTTETTIADTYEAHKLMNGYLEPNDIKHFELRLWLDESVTKEDEVMDKQFKSKISVTSTYIEEDDVLTFSEAVVKCGQSGAAATTCITDNMNLDKTLIYDDYSNLRYTGATPNNYVDIGDGSLWRIMGIIDNKLKIIRSVSIGEIVWNSGYNNTWSDSNIANYLNSSYTINSSLITTGDWNAGKTDYGLTVKNYYSQEQKIKWTGRVGLMTASDYGYAVGGDVRKICLNTTLNRYNTNSCAENNWIFNMVGTTYPWTMTAYNAYLDLVHHEDSSGRLGYVDINYAHSTFPVVYLNETTRITSGTGTSIEPYTFEL